MPINKRITATLVAAATFAAGAVAVSRSADAAAGHGHQTWFTSWAQSQQRLATTVLDNQSVRMITHLSLLPVRSPSTAARRSWSPRR